MDELTTWETNFLTIRKEQHADCFSLKIPYHSNVGYVLRGIGSWNKSTYTYTLRNLHKARVDALLKATFGYSEGLPQETVNVLVLLNETMYNPHESSVYLGGRQVVRRKPGNTHVTASPGCVLYTPDGFRAMSAEDAAATTSAPKLGSLDATHPTYVLIRGMCAEKAVEVHRDHKMSVWLHRAGVGWHRALPYTLPEYASSETRNETPLSESLKTIFEIE